MFFSKMTHNRLLVVICMTQFLFALTVKDHYCKQWAEQLKVKGSLKEAVIIHRVEPKLVWTNQKPVQRLFCLNLWHAFLDFFASVDESTSYAYRHRHKDIDNTLNIALNLFIYLFIFTNFCYPFRIRGAQWKSDRIWVNSWAGASRNELPSKTQSRLTEAAAPTTSAASTAKVRRVTMHQMKKCWKPLSSSFIGLEHTSVWIIPLRNTVFVFLKWRMVMFFCSTSRESSFHMHRINAKSTWIQGCSLSQLQNIC